MNKLIPFLLSGVLLVGAAACDNTAKTSSDAPDSTTEAPKAPDSTSSQDTKEDAGSEVRRAQLNADIRAREQRNKIGGNQLERAAGDLESEVRSKLEANVRGSQLIIDATEDGVVNVTGTVPNQVDQAKIVPLAKQIKGVKTVNADKVTVAAATNKDGGNKAPDATNKSP